MIGTEVEITLTQGKVAVIDLVDLPKVDRFLWTAVKDNHVWYAQTNVSSETGKRSTTKLHQIPMPVAALVDHEDGDGLNNRRSNLRGCGKGENAYNRSPRQGSSTPYKGVYFNKQKQKFIAQIHVGDKQIYLGQSDVPGDAAQAYDVAAVQHFGEFARPNFPIQQIA